MKRFLILLAGSLLLHACGPKVRTSLVSKSYAPLAYDEEVVVIHPGDEVPKEAIQVGSLKIGDGGFSTRCKYETVMAAAQLEARKAGGNLIYVTEHRPPDFFSTCHRIKAHIFKIENRVALQALKAESEGRFIDTTWDYALIHVYRPSTYGFLINYKLHLGDTVLCRVYTRFASTLKVKAEGTQVLWAQTETRKEVALKIERGHQYFLKCGLSSGIFVGRPTLELIPPPVGIQQFEKLKGKD